jgi:hypothetical protein
VKIAVPAGVVSALGLCVSVACCRHGKRRRADDLRRSSIGVRTAAVQRQSCQRQSYQRQSYQRHGPQHHPRVSGPQGVVHLSFPAVEMHAQEAEGRGRASGSAQYGNV